MGMVHRTTQWSLEHISGMQTALSSFPGQAGLHGGPSGGLSDGNALATFVATAGRALRAMRDLAMGNELAGESYDDDVAGAPDLVGGHSDAGGRLIPATTTASGRTAASKAVVSLSDVQALSLSVQQRIDQWLAGALLSACPGSDLLGPQRPASGQPSAGVSGAPFTTAPPAAMRLFGRQADRGGRAGDGDVPLSASGLPQITALLLELRGAGERLVRSLLEAVAAALAPAIGTPAEAAVRALRAALGEASAASDQVESLLHVLVGMVRMAKQIVPGPGRAAELLAALEDAAVGLPELLLRNLGPALPDALSSLAAVWSAYVDPTAGGGSGSVCEQGAVGAAALLFQGLHGCCDELLVSLGSICKVTGGGPTAAASTPGAAAAAAGPAGESGSTALAGGSRLQAMGTHLQALVTALDLLYGGLPQTGASARVLHATALLPILQVSASPGCRALTSIFS